jgi:hypothetical protein
MESSQPRPKRTDGLAATPDEPAAATNPELRGASAAPDLDAERRPLDVDHARDTATDGGDETPGGPPYDPAGSS